MFDLARHGTGVGGRLVAILCVAVLAGCAEGPVVTVDDGEVNRLSPEVLQMYGPVDDGEIIIPAVPPRALSERNVRQVVDYYSEEEPGTIIVDPGARFLYYVLGDMQAIRYGVAVGEAGLSYAGPAVIPVKKEWPSWTPTQNMIRRDPEQYGPWADGMQGGLQNPLGARALYLYRNGRDTYYRIHGTNDVYSIGQATSAGCIRLYNQDILDLYGRTEPGTRVVVLTPAQAGQGAVPDMRGGGTLTAALADG